MNPQDPSKAKLTHYHKKEDSSLLRSGQSVEAAAQSVQASRGLSHDSLRTQRSSLLNRMTSKDDFCFWYGLALKEWTEMARLACDFSAVKGVEFYKAKERFELAKSRAVKCQKEELTSLFSPDNEGASTSEETGQPL